jgi:DNA polymerase-1
MEETFKLRRDKIIFPCNPRVCFEVEEGYVHISCDYAGQELITAAAWSKDQTMTDSYLVPPKLTLPDGTIYVNPKSDLHTLSAVNCIAPELKQKPEHEWRGLADSTGARKSAKSLNFGAIYLMTAATAAQNFGVKEEVASQWLSNHKTTYTGYYAWAEEYGKIAAARGFAVSPVSKLIRWVNEENAKGVGESSLRAAVNHSIQGECSQMMKEAMLQVRKAIRGTDVKILNSVHDELNVKAPGKCWVDEEKTTIDSEGRVVDHNGKPCMPTFTYNKEAEEVAELVMNIMVNVETQFFQAAGSPLTGRAEYKIGPIWLH